MDEFLLMAFLPLRSITLGAESQIISTIMCADVPMELCDAWIGSYGISLSEHVPPHSSLDHVFSVRRWNLTLLIKRLTRSGNLLRSLGWESCSWFVKLDR